MPDTYNKGGTHKVEDYPDLIKKPSKRIREIAKEIYDNHESSIEWAKFEAISQYLDEEWEKNNDEFWWKDE